MRSKTALAAAPALSKKAKFAQRRRTVHADKRGRRFVWAMLSSRNFLSRVSRFMIDVLRAVEFRDNALFVQLGLHDPADTGQISGLLGPLLSFIPNARFEPDFFAPCFVLQARSTVRIVPLRFVKLAVLLACAPELWQAVKSGIKAAR